MSNIKITLKAARINIGLSQKEAAEKLGVHYQTLASWEKDSSDMPHSKINAAAKLYGIPMRNIFFGKENEFIRFKMSNIENTIKQNQPT